MEAILSPTPDIASLFCDDWRCASESCHLAVLSPTPPAAKLCLAAAAPVLAFWAPVEKNDL
jgi:hypothetical protein